MARPVNPDALFAQRLRAARERLGLSQRELGLLVGMAPNVAAPRINQYERGSAEPSIDDLQQLAEALGLPAAALVTEDAGLHRLLVAWADAPAKARAQVVKQLEAHVASSQPGRRATLKRIEQARTEWAAEREAALRKRARKAPAKRATRTRSR